MKSSYLLTLKVIYIGPCDVSSALKQQKNNFKEREDSHCFKFVSYNLEVSNG